jgi:hypothetical protein
MADKGSLRKIYTQETFKQLDYESFLETLSELQRRGYTMGLADGYALVKAGELGAQLEPGNLRPIAQKAHNYAMNNSQELYDAFVLAVGYHIGGQRSVDNVAKAMAEKGKFIR